MNLLNQKNDKLIIVGSGLAGIVSADLFLQKGFKVILIEKQDKIGGNSCKATSGINGIFCNKFNKSIQDLQDIQEQFQSFLVDTFLAYYDISYNQQLEIINLYKINDTIDNIVLDIINHRLNQKVQIENQDQIIKIIKYIENISKIQINQERLELMQQLAQGSEQAMNYLINVHNFNFDCLKLLGGHRKARTFCKNKLGIGKYLVDGIYNKIKENKNLKIYLNSKVIELLLIDNEIKGVKFEQQQEGIKIEYCKMTILSSGGYSQNKDLLDKKYIEYKSSNGKFANGDLIEISQKQGIETIDLDLVQIHPTGFLSNKKDNSEQVILAPESLRAEGAILLNQSFKRFVNELSTRSNIYQLQQQQTNSSYFYLLMNQNMVDQFGDKFKFYIDQQHFLIYQSVYHLNQTYPNIINTINIYNHNYQLQKDEFNKSVLINGQFELDRPVYLAQVQPVVHYTMGGIKINKFAQTFRNNSIIINLFAVGEVAGGVHGKNRLAANSLLECVVYPLIISQYVK